MEQLKIPSPEPQLISTTPPEPIPNKVEVKPENEIEEFLTKINSIINSIRTEDGKQYSLLSSIFHCFYENKKLSLSKSIINDYIQQDILKYKNKMIISFVENGTNSMETINEANYLKKIQTIISRNKCITVHGDIVSIDTDFVHSHKLLIYRNLFGKEIDIVKNSLKPKRVSKIRNSLGPKKIIKNFKKIRQFDSSPITRGVRNSNKDYDIEIVETENDDTDVTQKKKFPPVKPIYLNRPQLGDYNMDGIKYIKNNNMGNELRKPQFLEKKRRNEIYIKNDQDSDERSENIIKYGEDKSNNKKEEIIAEKEILSLIENGKFFLSLFKDKEMLNAIEEQNKKMENSDNYVKKLLAGYENGSYLKNYLLMLNVDFNEFQRSITNLIITQDSLSKSEDKFLTKFSTMNKIIMAKEKCNLLIEKIIIKLKQLILEYNFIQKVLDSVEMNKNSNFIKFQEVMSNVKKKKEKENYFAEVKSKLQEQLSNAIIIGK